ncbi:MAG: hypothetical protein HN392_04005 [Anaerolineae bacterium]|jgi:tetratricopeptide (TPR) repeat protein|nr:hypothetical protein [Anaerolineae bacterium]MBT7073738.1 hypothetical protein [Anaerolineae bacterium]MBT7783199.1 hypothetical protein [Anaerolineae bacterium]
MDGDERVREAIEKAKLGHELSARALFIEIVKENRDNKLAWLWLIGLLDDPKDLIIACEAVLRLDPSEKKVASRLKELRRLEKKNRKEDTNIALSKIDMLLAQGNIELALTRLRKLLQENDQAEDAWFLLVKHTPNIEEKEQALARIYALDPKNKEKEKALRSVRFFRKNPLELAKSYEEKGQIKEAVKIYENLARKAQGRGEWDRLLREINRLEKLKKEKIVYISPRLTIARLSIGVPLLFLAMVITQIGYDFQHFTFLMGVEFLMVIFGSFLAAVAAVSSEHRIWQELGNVAGRGSIRLRMVLVTTGTTIMLLPFILLGLEAYTRWPTVFEYLN